MLEGYALDVETGIRWYCKVCAHYQEPVENEEWPYHCDTIMSMRPWYRPIAVKEPTP